MTEQYATEPGTRHNTTFKGNICFFVLNVYVLNLSSQGVFQRCIGVEVQDHNVRICTFAVSKAKSINDTFFNCEGSGVKAETAGTGGFLGILSA